VTPRRSWKSSKRRTRRKQSHRINRVQRPPITETVRAIEQIFFAKFVPTHPLFQQCLLSPCGLPAPDLPD